MKRICLSVCLCAILLITQAAAPGSQAATSSAKTASSLPISVELNGELVTLSAPPVMKNGSVYVPLRSILTKLGANVQWEEATGNVTAQHHGITVQIKANSKQGTVDGREVTINPAPLLISGITYISIRWLNETFGAAVKWRSTTRTVSVYYPDQQLPRVESYTHLQKLMTQSAELQGYGLSNLTVKTMDAIPPRVQTDNVVQESAKAADSGSSTGSASGPDYSATNTQVQGVDEADVIKTDGNYIYQVNRQRIIITSAKPADQMKLVAQVNYGDGSFNPQELYVDDKHLVVIGSGSPYTANDLPLVESKKMLIYPPKPYISITKAIVYDISDKSAPKQIRELELEGSYLSSRKIGDSLYLISNKYADIYTIMNGHETVPAPMVRDSAVQDRLTEIAYTDIRYFPGFVEPSYMLVASVDLSAGEPMDVQTFLGSGQNIYASSDHLYVAVTKYEMPLVGENPIDQQNASIMIVPTYSKPSTEIYKFSLNRSSVTYMAKGKVPGTIINQFAMDEFEEHFRIATTTGELWGSGQSASKNNLYILNEALAQVGQIEGIAPGERIYSVRFTGKRAYMVTFRTVDPLFVIDVADPAKPSILGALKIPGYSDYLHPYDDNHLIGFGKDTVEVDNKDDAGNTVSTNAFYLGMKVALFDVTDVEHPKELHKVIIGDRGTNSELLYNHKALLFSKEKNLLAFPVDLYEVQGSKGATKQGQMPQYGTFSYQGAYVYSLNPANGFQLRGTITHLTQDEWKKSGNYWSGDNSVRRILYIGDTLYTVSDGQIKANAMNDLKEIGSVNIPMP